MSQLWAHGTTSAPYRPITLSHTPLHTKSRQTVRAIRHATRRASPFVVTSCGPVLTLTTPAGLRTLLYAETARSNLLHESWDVPGAYSPASADPNYRQTVKQPILSIGTERAPGMVAVMDKAMQGAGDANRFSFEHRDKRIISWGWSKLDAEPSTFYITHLDKFSRMVADTDDLLVSTNCASYLAQQRLRFESEWQITIQSPVHQHNNLRLDRTPITLTISNPKCILEFLAQHNLQDCNPSPTPHMDGHDLSTRQPNEPLLSDIPQYQSLVGSLRYFADTTHPSISFIVGILGLHLQQPTARHAAPAHRVLRYLRGTHDRGLAFSSETKETFPYPHKHSATLIGHNATTPAAPPQKLSLLLPAAPSIG
jgi:hypothetical protein